jgi:hypothetical protein
MAYLGIGYTGNEPDFLKNQVNKYNDWLKGDRLPHFYGNSFVVLYDSNTAREFARKCKDSAEQNTIVLYSMNRVA